MKKFSSYFILCIFLFSCVNYFADSDDEDCDDTSSCQLEKPKMGTLDITLTINSENQSVLVKIFNGNYENNDLVESFTAIGTEYSVDLEIGDYSVTALYKQGVDSILAVDGDEIEISSEVKCNNTCWEVSNAEVDLTL